MIEDLGRFGVKTLVFAGGNPLLRTDLPELVNCAAAEGLRPVLVTNGTLMTPAVTKQLCQAGLETVKICTDGIGDGSGRQGGKNGPFRMAMAGYRNCHEVGLPVTLRLPLARRHFARLDSIFDFLEQEGISQVCFQHLLYAGRDNGPPDDLSHAQSRRALDLIWQRAKGVAGRPGVSISTAANHVDGIYLSLKLIKQDPHRAPALLEELRRKGGGNCGSGVGIGHIDAQGSVHPDPAWPTHSFGNIRQRSFREIWFDLSDPLMFGLKHRLPLLKGRCAACRWKPLCAGNIRSRAAMVYGDPWMPDPACYLTNEERRQDVTGLGAGENTSQKKKAA
jgi:radical SAM protein with 4Fe4S-binding SPASM domain